LSQIDACWIITPQIIIFMFCIKWIAYLKHADEFKDKQNLFQHLAQSLYDYFVYLILMTSYTQIFARGVEPEHPHHETSNLQRVHNVQRTKLGYTCHQAKEPSGVRFLSQFSKNTHLCTYPLQRTITHLHVGLNQSGIHFVYIFYLWMFKRIDL
jgi:hypothetical protein